MSSCAASSRRLPAQAEEVVERSGHGAAERRCATVHCAKAIEPVLTTEIVTVVQVCVAEAEHQSGADTAALIETLIADRQAPHQHGSVRVEVEPILPVE